jgi:hypothetical protein
MGHMGAVARSLAMSVDAVPASIDPLAVRSHLLSCAISILGAVELFLGGAVVYLFAVTSLSILLATIVNSMPQFALLSIPVFVVMFLLSGSFTPFENRMTPVIGTSCGTWFSVNSVI